MTDCSLTPRQHEVLLLTARGMGLREIAHALGVSRDTAKHHRTAAVRRLGCADTHQAVAEHTLAHVLRVERRRRRREAATEPLWPDAPGRFVMVAA